MPVAVAVNGVVSKSHAIKPGRISGGGGKLIVNAEEGDKVALYLNSDAGVGFRSNPVYAVTVSSSDIIVTITEKYGKHTDADTPVLAASKAPATMTVASKKPQLYVAPLTGDIWKKISHKYTADEAKSMIPADQAITRDAVASIYDGTLSMQNPTLNVRYPGTSPGSPPLTVTMTFDDSDNPKSNISDYNLYDDGLTRVHPRGYAALLNAAKDAGVTNIKMTSAWRPLLGSIAHRSGLGLDVNYVTADNRALRYNRQELRGKAGAPDLDWTSNDEKMLLKEYEEAAVAETSSKAELDSIEKSIAAAKSTDLVKSSQLENDRASAEIKLNNAIELRKKKLSAWNAERDRNQPPAVAAMRKALLEDPGVKQLFDPWYMDSNARDKKAATPNFQLSANEKLHANHLHITVNEPKILG